MQFLPWCNKKSVDIAVVRDVGDSITVDVKGLAGRTGWPVDNIAASLHRSSITRPEVARLCLARRWFNRQDGTGMLGRC